MILQKPCYAHLSTRSCSLYHTHTHLSCLCSMILMHKCKHVCITSGWWRNNIEPIRLGAYMGGLFSGNYVAVWSDLWRPVSTLLDKQHHCLLFLTYRTTDRNYIATAFVSLCTTPLQRFTPSNCMFLRYWKLRRIVVVSRDWARTVTTEQLQSSVHALNRTCSESQHHAAQYMGILLGPY